MGTPQAGAPSGSAHIRPPAARYDPLTAKHALGHLADDRMARRRVRHLLRPRRAARLSVPSTRRPRSRMRTGRSRLRQNAAGLSGPRITCDIVGRTFPIASVRRDPQWRRSV